MDMEIETLVQQDNKLHSLYLQISVFIFGKYSMLKAVISHLYILSIHW
jgi:hypothetical protein